MTVRETPVVLAFLQQMTERLKTVNETGASWELREILHAKTGIKFFDLMVGEASLSRGATEAVEEAVDRRLLGEPLGYITGEVVFMDLRLALDASALVPRVETGLLVLEAADFCVRENRALRGLDMGSGSGNISCALLKRAPMLFMDAVEISEKAADLTRRNLERHGFSPRSRVIHADYRKENHFLRYDLIVANPPYVSEGDFLSLAREVQSEPRQALVAGPEGGEVLRWILANMPAHLAQGGALLLEIGQGQSEALAQFAEENAPLKLLKIIKDHQDIDRVMVFVKD